MILGLHKKLHKHHLPDAPVNSGVRVTSKVAGVLKSGICFISCEKPNGQPVTTCPVGLLARLLQYFNMTYFCPSSLRNCSLKLEVIFDHHFSLDMILPQQPAHFRSRSRMVAPLDFVSFEPSTSSPSYGVLGFLLSIKPEIKRVHH